MNRTITEPAWVEGMPAETYHADAVASECSLSASMAESYIAATPMHAREKCARLNPDYEREDKTSFDIGSAFHAYMTGTGSAVHRVEADGWTTKAAREERDAARERGMTPLLADQHDRLMRMVRSARLQLRASGLGDVFEAGVCEASAFWRSGGVWNRARPDATLFEERIVYDLKSTAELADPDKWTKRSYGFGVDVRAAHYLDGMDVLHPGPTPWRYRFVVVEVKPPHGLSIVELDEAALEIGRRKIKAARDLHRECLAADRWPCWPAAVAVMQPPPWEMERWLNREVRDADRRAATPSRRLIDTAIQFQAP